MTENDNWLIWLGLLGLTGLVGAVSLNLPGRFKFNPLKRVDLNKAWQPATTPEEIDDRLHAAFNMHMAQNPPIYKPVFELGKNIVNTFSDFKLNQQVLGVQPTAAYYSIDPETMRIYPIGYKNQAGEFVPREDKNQSQTIGAWVKRLFNPAMRRILEPKHYKMNWEKYKIITDTGEEVDPIFYLDRELLYLTDVDDVIVYKVLRKALNLSNTLSLDADAIRRNAASIDNFLAGEPAGGGDAPFLTGDDGYPKSWVGIPGVLTEREARVDMHENLSDKVTGILPLEDHGFPGLRMRFSNDWIDMLMKSTGQTWGVGASYDCGDTSCERIGGCHQRGVWDDIANKNIVVFVEPVQFPNRPLARLLLRLCEDEDGNKTFGLEAVWYTGTEQPTTCHAKGKKVYWYTGDDITIATDPSIPSTMPQKRLRSSIANNIIKIYLEDKGFNQRWKECVTPYKLQTYSDMGAEEGNGGASGRQVTYRPEPDVEECDCEQDCDYMTEECQEECDCDGRCNCEDPTQLCEDVTGECRRYCGNRLECCNAQEDCQCDNEEHWTGKYKKCCHDACESELTDNEEFRTGDCSEIPDTIEMRRLDCILGYTERRVLYYRSSTNYIPVEQLQTRVFNPLSWYITGPPLLIYLHDQHRSNIENFADSMLYYGNSHSHNDIVERIQQLIPLDFPKFIRLMATVNKFMDWDCDKAVENFPLLPIDENGYQMSSVHVFMKMRDAPLMILLTDFERQNMFDFKADPSYVTEIFTELHKFLDTGYTDVLTKSQLYIDQLPIQRVLPVSLTPKEKINQIFKRRWTGGRQFEFEQWVAQLRNPGLTYEFILECFEIMYRYGEYVRNRWWS